MNLVNIEFQKAGIRGITLVTGSGDWGTECNKQCNKFKPDFPSSSPYIVSVGATNFETSNLTSSEEATLWSSGGFSDIFPRPYYQNSVISKFLQITKTPTSYFNISGRGFPDVSAIGVNFQIFVSGVLMNVSGTSASTPTFASILSLINDIRLKKKLSYIRICFTIFISSI
jgi:tripeptidyl-peptidase-1